MSKARNRNYIVSLLKTIIAILAVWYLFESDRITKESFIKLLNPNNLLFFTFSGMAFFCAQMLATGRLLILLRTIDLPLRFSYGFRLTMIGNFFNMVIPGMVGGDLVKGFYLFKDEQNSRGRSSSMIVMDRVLGMLALVFIGQISIIYLLNNNTAVINPYRKELYVVSVVVSLLFTLFALFLVLGRNRTIRRLLDRWLTALLRRSIFYNMATGLGDLVTKNRIIFHTFLLSLLIQIFSLAGLLMLSNLLSEALPGLIAMAAVSSVVLLIGAVPVTPGNIGWTELIASFGWSAIGSNAGAEIFLYWRIVMIICSLPGGLLYLFMTRKNKQYSESVK